MNLDIKERLILSYLLKILEKLEPNEADYYARNRKAIEHGYSLHYNWITENLHEEMSENDCKFVLDVLDMFRNLNYSYIKGNLSDEKLKEKIRFKGFDGNREINFLSYAHYFMHDLDRYNELHDNSEHPNYNTHYPVVEKYKRMLEVWKKVKISDMGILTLQQINEILKA